MMKQQLIQPAYNSAKYVAGKISFDGICMFPTTAVLVKAKIFTANSEEELCKDHIIL
jgi:hypothetical protein